VFGVPFRADSVVVENRQSVGVFPGRRDGGLHVQLPSRAGCRCWPARYRSPQAAVRRGLACSSRTSLSPADVSDQAWRQGAGALLKRHQLFVNLLKLIKGGVVSYDMLTEAFARNMPCASQGQVGRCWTPAGAGGLGLREGKQPLVTLRVQLWVRELRRMVGKLASTRRRQAAQ
jgi:DEAD/DEAH box helicase domain-containing protein